MMIKCVGRRTIKTTKKDVMLYSSEATRREPYQKICGLFQNEILQEVRATYEGDDPERGSLTESKHGDARDH